MEKPVQILHVLLIFHLLGAAASEEGWWSIDCGSGGSSRAINGSISWLPDTNYTKTGTNARVPQNQALEEMNTLRFFPNKTENNCYIIPLQFPGFNYIVRAGFYYGNYDGLSKPPTFDLKLDRENWTTVNTSSAAGGENIPIYHEAIYLTRSGNLTVCLVQTRDREVPFISSLEGVPISGIYKEVLDTTTATLHLVARTNYGGSEVRYPNDRHNRIWTRGVTPPNCHANVSTRESNSIPPVNDEPLSMLIDYIESTKVTDPIILTVDLPHQSTPLPGYFVFYLADLSYPTDGNFYTRTMQIYINGQEMSTVTIYYESSKAVTVYPLDVVGPTINITLVAAKKSTSPPIINGIEIFTRHDLTGQPGSTINPYPSDAPKHFLSVYVILIHIICLWFYSYERNKINIC